MIRFVVGRVAWALLSVWFVVTVVFALLHVLPGDPARVVAGQHAPPEVVAQVRESLGLDRPLLERYGSYVAGLARGDLGKSFQTGAPVREIVAEHAWATVQLGVAAVFLQLLIGVPLGAWAAVRRGRTTDRVAFAVSVLGQSAPTFFVGILLVFLFAYVLPVFPVAGYGEGLLERLHHLCLPAVTLAFAGVAYYVQIVRGDLVEVLREDYIRTARAKGLSPRRILWKHALRNALLPLLTVAGTDLAMLLGGAVVTELIFGWPGLGREAVLAIFNLDLPVLLGVVQVAALAVVALSLAVDLCYGLLDPRVRLVSNR